MVIIDGYGTIAHYPKDKNMAFAADGPTLDEISKKKLEIEKNIALLLTELQQCTGLSVSSVELDLNMEAECWVKTTLQLK